MSISKMQNQQQQQAHVAVMAFPFGTHAAPLLSLIRRLAAAAPHVTFSFLNTAKSNASTFIGGVAEDNIRVIDVDDGVPDGYVFTGKRLEDMELFLAAAPQSFKKGLDKAVSVTNKKITCLLTDAFLWFTADIAQEMSIPWLTLWTAAASALTSHIYTDLIRQTIAGSNDMESPLSFVPGLSPDIRVKDLPLEVYGGNLNSAIAVMAHQMGKTITRATAVCINSFHELDPDLIHHLIKSKLNNCLTVGPFNLISSASSPASDDPQSCLTWLSKQKPSSVAYVSFGTVTTLPPPEIAALAEALEESGVAFLWSLKDGQKVHLPEGFLEGIKENGKGKVVPWAPQTEVLSHSATGAFVSHCGWNSVLESITGGVPMICRPFFGDQGLNARLVSAVWGFGVVAKGGSLSKDGVKGDLEMVLNSKQGQMMRDKVADLKHLAEQAVGPEGSSTKNFGTLLELVTKV